MLANHPPLPQEVAVISCLGFMAQWEAKCKGCQNIINHWATFREEEGEDGWVAYCFKCDHEDLNMLDDKGREHWTLRVRCQHWEGAGRGPQCERTWQSCRTIGSASHQKCLKWWGWHKSCRRLWYCPEHARTLDPPPREEMECDCSRRFPDPTPAPAPPDVTPPVPPRAQRPIDWLSS
ncbi:hypothetical protein N9L68_03450 [bacterium]|nr:hypothetical protein [bacterium]